MDTGDDTSAKAAVLKDIISWSKTMKAKHGKTDDSQPELKPDADDDSGVVDDADTGHDGADGVLSKLMATIKSRKG